MSVLSLTIEDVRFDPATHTSSLPDGRDVPHVTTILRTVGVATDFDDLVARGYVRAEAIRLAGLRGAAVHADCHAYDDNDLDWNSVHPSVRPYVEAWATCRNNLGLEPLARERRLFNAGDFYTGAMDGLFLLPSRKKIVLIDTKTGDPESGATEFQTAAYLEAAIKMGVIDDVCFKLGGKSYLDFVIERWAVWLKPERRVPYEIVNYSTSPDAEYDYLKFRAYNITYQNQADRRPRRR